MTRPLDNNLNNGSPDFYEPSRIDGDITGLETIWMPTVDRRQFSFQPVSPDNYTDYTRIDNPSFIKGEDDLFYMGDYLGDVFD
jgi:hypothetical protein